eukprot:4724428-Pleurochrysis_carterae.AAC.1
MPTTPAAVDVKFPSMREHMACCLQRRILHQVGHEGARAAKDTLRGKPVSDTVALGDGSNLPVARV